MINYSPGMEQELARAKMETEFAEAERRQYREKLLEIMGVQKYRWDNYNVLQAVRALVAAANPPCAYCENRTLFACSFCQRRRCITCACLCADAVASRKLPVQSLGQPASEPKRA